MLPDQFTRPRSVIQTVSGLFHADCEATFRGRVAPRPSDINPDQAMYWWG